jgi:hypothetical protein
MTTGLGVIAVVSLTSLVLAAGCAAQTGDDEADPLSADADLTSTLRLPDNGSKTVAINASADGDVTVTVDCRPPADPDDVGPVIKVDASSIGGSASDPARAGYYQITTSVTAGAHDIKVDNQGPAVSCSVRSTPVPASATCKAWSAWRSPNTDHTHLHVGVEAISAGWEPFPASGNHWGSWAPWNKVYEKAIKRGFLLHNLEHGGIVLSYKCSSSSDSAECKAERDQLVSFSNSLGFGRVIITPDPTQPQKFAIRAWRYAYTSDCFDETSAAAFAHAHVRHGREDIDADPPIPFDPTTTNVPCQDLMAAPDSCN